MEKQIRQYFLTPAAGKRLIAKSLPHIPSIGKALKNGTVVIIAGTTNGYAAEEMLRQTDQLSGFSRKRFFRGISLPPRFTVDDTGRLPDQSKFPGDVVISRGKWEHGKTIFDMAGILQQGDIIIKGANAVNPEQMQAAICIGHPTGGTISAALQAVVGRRVELCIPVGLEKRVYGDIDKIARKLNSVNASGLRYQPVNGTIVTELEAINILTGVEAELVAAGGVCGAEGSCWIAVTGSDTQLADVDSLVREVSGEPPFEL